MNRRTVYLIVCILVLVQIFIYCMTQKNNTDLYHRQTVQIERNIRSLNAEEAQLKRKIALVDNIIKTIPVNLLSGFEDPEKGFAEFLDYLNNPIVEELRVSIGLTEAQKFHSDPVALHKTRLNFKFRFLSTYEAERFFNFLLHQDKYPVQVEDMKITRSSHKANDTEVSLDVALYIPAKLQLPSNI